mmetsp:Transcript_11718/g.27754  ORF Transcript_11718/g.27754 Transcript_11718/m.27754 type:complete len:569 (+) Transcript_11718:1000-2706(+)
MFSRLQRGHFDERVQSALQSLKVFRLLFAVARASGRRAARARARASTTVPPLARTVDPSLPGASRVSRVSGHAEPAEMAPARPSRFDGEASARPFRFDGILGSLGTGSKTQLLDVARVTSDQDGAAVDGAAVGNGTQAAKQANGADVGGGGASGLSVGAVDVPPHGPSTRFDGGTWEDECFDGELDDQLALLRDAMSIGNGFVSSLAQAREKGTKAFARLLAEAGGTDAARARAIPSEWLRQCVLNAARLNPEQGGDSGARRKLVEKMSALFCAEYVTETEFVAATERAYKEQRYIGAAADSYDSLHDHVRTFLIGAWGALLAVAGVFLVDWGVELQQWVMPFSSTVLSAALVLGWLPYETISGIMYVLVVRPYDIGDRIVIADIGRPPTGFEQLIVSEIGLTCTRVICWNGEQHNLMNHIIRKQGVINFHRSGQAIVSHRLELPSSMACNKISELIDAVRAYVAGQPHDYVRVEAAFIVEPRYQLALLDVQIDVQSAHKRNEDGLICVAKSNLFLFVHAYLQASGVEYTRAPYPPLRVSPELHATLGRAMGVPPPASPSSGAFRNRC